MQAIKQLPSVSVGIPAYNEANNIGLLISDILKQSTRKYNIENIIIASDGSTDNTEDIVNSFKNKKVIFINNLNREGVASRQNELLRESNSDILVLLNADIRIDDSLFIEKLIDPIKHKRADLTSPALKETPPRTYFESVIIAGMQLKNVLFETWRNGQNGYMCHGAVRAFSKRLYKQINFRKGNGEDMYSYLFCLMKNYKFSFVPEAHVWYRSPSTFNDHLKQSIRFFKYQNDFRKQLDSILVANEINIPKYILIKGGIKSIPLFLKYPIRTICYVFFVIEIKLLLMINMTPKDLWNAKTTKHQ